MQNIVSRTSLCLPTTNGMALLSVCGIHRNNIEATLNLLECMKMQDGCRKLVFSSSATVYGVPESLPLHEGSTVGMGITNPYGMCVLCVQHQYTLFFDPQETRDKVFTTRTTTCHYCRLFEENIVACFSE